MNDILVPTDFSEISQRALEYAKAIAKLGEFGVAAGSCESPGNLITPPEAAWVDLSEVQSLQEEQLEQSGAALRSEGFRAQAISITGPLYDELLSAVKQYKVDLIVLGTHGKKGLERFLLGSDAEAVLGTRIAPSFPWARGSESARARRGTIREVICATDSRSALG